MKAILEPAMAEAGFAVAYPDFRRAEGDTLHLGQVQFWKYGGRFTLEFAVQIGPFTDWKGDLVPPSELTVAHTALVPRARLRREGRHNIFGERDYFPYEAIADDRPALDALMQEIIGYLPQIEAWLRDGTAGPNVFAPPPIVPE